MMRRSYFLRAIEGELGEGIQKMYKKEMEDMVKRADEKAIVEDDGAIKWTTNGNYIPDDCCEELEYAGYDFSRSATAVKRDAQEAQQLESYMNREHHYSAEDMYEMRSAFGTGTTVVDIITGETIQL